MGILTSPRRPPLEQTQNRPHRISLADGGNQLHFRGAGIGEADVHAAIDQGFQERFCTVHDVLSPQKDTDHLKPR